MGKQTVIRLRDFILGLTGEPLAVVISFQQYFQC